MKKKILKNILKKDKIEEEMFGYRSDEKRK